MMTAIAGPLSEPHAIETCMGSPRHCWSHHIDAEPLKGYRWCLECCHMFATAGELLAEHNKVLAALGAAPETDAESVFCCAFCTHDW